MFKAEMIAPCGLDCNICSQALIENDPGKRDGCLSGAGAAAMDLPELWQTFFGP